MCAFRILSNSVSKVTDKTFKRKYIALGRIVTHWPQIIGQKMAMSAQPKKIHYRKARRKGDPAIITLDVATSSANASLLIMQKGVLIEKINHIFGEQMITDIRFVHQPSNSPSESYTKPKKPLSEQEKSALSQKLNHIEDNAVRERLMKFGAAFMQDQKQ